MCLVSSLIYKAHPTELNCASSRYWQTSQSVCSKRLTDNCYEIESYELPLHGDHRTLSMMDYLTARYFFVNLFKYTWKRINTLLILHQVYTK